MVEDGDVAEHLVGRVDRGDDPLAVHAQPREGGHLHRAAMVGDLPQHPLDAGVVEHPRRCAVPGDRLPAVLVDVRPAGVGEQVEGGVLDHHRAAEEVRERLCDLVQALAVQDQLGEAAMDRHRLLQAGVLSVDDPLQERLHQVDPGDLLAEREEGQVEPVGGLRHPARELVDVHAELDHQPRATNLGDGGDQLQLGGGVIPNRVGGGQEQVARAALAGGLRRFDDAHPLDPPVEAAAARDQLCFAEAALPHRLPHGRRGDQPVSCFRGGGRHLLVGI